MRTVLVAFAAVATIGVLAGCGGTASSKAPYTDAEACAWLKESLPQVPDTAVGAQAQLAIGLASFFADHGGLPGADGYALDGAFARGCPALHVTALKKAGIKSFGNL